MKPEGKAPLQHLVEIQTTEILAMSEDQQLVHTAEDTALSPDTVYDIDGIQVEVQQADDSIFLKFASKSRKMLTAQSN